METNGKILQTSLLNLIKASVKWYNKNKLYIHTFLYIIYCLIVNVLNLTVYQKGLSILLMGLLHMIILGWLKEVDKVKSKHKNSVPVRSKRFTKIENETAYIDKSELPQIILYLSAVEDYLENLGYYN